FNAKFHTDYWPNAWAEEILLLWPMLLWVLWGRKSKRAGRGRRLDWLKAAVLGLVIGSLLLSYSRGGALVFLGQLLLLALLVFLSRGCVFPWRRAGVIGLMTFAVALVLFAGLNHVRSRFHPIESVTRKVTFSSDEGASSISERVQFWKQAVFLAGEKPLLGWGPYSFRFVQPRLQHSVLATSDHPHNVFLKIAMERGIPAAFLFLLFIVAVLTTGVRKFLRDGGLKDAVLLVGVAGVLAHNMIDYNLQFVGIGLPLWISFGLLASGKQKRIGGQLLSKGVELTVSILLLLLALTEGTFLYFSFIARRAEAAGDAAAALEWYNRTNRALFSRDQWLSRGVISLSLERLSDARLATERYLQMNEQDARAWRLLGDIGLRAGNYREAFNAYTRAYAFGRYNDIGITRGFVYVSAHSKLLGARRKDVDELMNEFGLAIEQNTHFVALSKNVEELVSLSDLMAQIFPADHQAYRALAREATLSAREVRARFTARSRGLLW
ncbi:MAG: O-antigen ligase family protein, partial [Candidatus Peribacteraceae bacterium]